MLFGKAHQGERAKKMAVLSVVYPADLKKGDPLFEYIARDENVLWCPFTKITLIDLEQPENPSIVASYYIEGQYLSARRVDGSVYIVSTCRKEISGLIYYPELSFSPEPVSEDTLKEAIDLSLIHI